MWAGRVLAGRLLPEARPATVWAGAWLLAATLGYALFRVSAANGLFTGWLLFPLAIAAAVALETTIGRRFRWTWPAVDVRGLLREEPLLWVALAPGTLAVARLLRGTVAPPLGWDALNYHVFRAGVWAQTGSTAVQPAPDAWSYYQWFPTAGDALWSYGFLVAPDGLLLAPLGGLVLGAVCLGAYAAARELGGARGLSALVAVSVASVPSVAVAATAAYVDNCVLASVLLASVFGVRAVRDGRFADAALAGLGVGLAGAVKQSALGVAIGLFGALALQAVVARRPSAFGIALLSAASLLALEYGPTWWGTGSPTWPMPALGFAGDELHAATLAGRVCGGNRPGLDGWLFVLRLFWPIGGPSGDYLALGPTTVVAVGVGLYGLLRLERGLGLLLVGGAIGVIGPLLSPDVIAAGAWLPRPVGWVLAGIAVAWLLLALPQLRASWRYPVYASAARQRSYDLHRLWRPGAESWKVWREVDKDPARIAVSAGWSACGHHWYLYPLLGSRLQNEVVWVAPVEGASYWKGDWTERFDVAAWRRRLGEEGVDVYVALPPAAPEAEAAAAHPEWFERVDAGRELAPAAYRLR